MDVWTVAGNLGRDAELKTLPSGMTVLNFGVAKTKMVKGERVTEWVDCSWFGERAAKVAPFLKSGCKVTVIGRAGIRVWLKNGEACGTLTMTVDDLALQGDKGGATDAAPRAAAPASRPAATPSTRPPAAPPASGFADDDDIPF